jgi:hypothetical protein
MIVVTNVVCGYSLGITLRVKVNLFKVYLICHVSVSASVRS